MTAHRIKPCITPERVDWFARYYSQNMAWGVFHACLDDGNYFCGAADRTFRPGSEGPGNVTKSIVGARYDFTRDEWPADLRDAAEWFDRLTESQRRRLGEKAERRAEELKLVPGPWKPSGAVVVTAVNVASGTITVDTDSSRVS